MKHIVFLLSITILTIGSGMSQDRYAQYEVILSDAKAVNRVVLSRFNLKPINGVVYCEYGDKGNYVNGKAEGEHRDWWVNGQLKFINNYKNGIKDGTCMEWTSNGKLESKVKFKEGKKDGVCMKWNGAGLLIMETNYKDGQLDGLFKNWHKTGQLIYEGNYKDGKLDGLFNKWYKTGQLFRKENYKEGKKDGVCMKWNGAGLLIMETNYKDGQLDGLFKNWHKNGQLYEESNYKDGKRDGLFKRGYRNGQLIYEGNYKDGKLDGLWKFWYENGQLKREVKEMKKIYKEYIPKELNTFITSELPGWHQPPTSWWGGIYKQNITASSLINFITGDFNCDGNKDYVLYLTNKDSTEFSLYLFHGNKMHDFELINLFGVQYGGIGFDGSSSITWVGEGIYSMNGPDTIRGFENDYNTIIECDYFSRVIFEKSADVIYWNGKQYVSLQTGD